MHGGPPPPPGTHSPEGSRAEPAEAAEEKAVGRPAAGAARQPNSGSRREREGGGLASAARTSIHPLGGRPSSRPPRSRLRPLSSADCGCQAPLERSSSRQLQPITARPRGRLRTPPRGAARQVPAQKAVGGAGPGREGGACRRGLTRRQDLRVSSHGAPPPTSVSLRIRRCL